MISWRRMQEHIPHVFVYVLEFSGWGNFQAPVGCLTKTTSVRLQGGQDARLVRRGAAGSLWLLGCWRCVSCGGETCETWGWTCWLAWPWPWPASSRWRPAAATPDAGRTRRFSSGRTASSSLEGETLGCVDEWEALSERWRWLEASLPKPEEDFCFWNLQFLSTGGQNSQLHTPETFYHFIKYERSFRVWKVTPVQRRF